MEQTRTWLRYRSGENFTERLRTQGVQIAVPVLVRGREGNRSFEEATHSVSVNANGGIVRLSEQVVLAQQISIFNPKTAKEASGMVTFVGLRNAGKRDIGIEFSEPSVPFWGIAFPGWNLSDRKRPTHKPQGTDMKAEDRHSQLASATNGPHDSAPRPHPPLTVEESIVMRAFAAGKSDKQVCIELRIPLQSFHRLLRNMIEKTGTCDRIGLHVWALRQRQCGDSREAERNYKWRRPA